MKKATIIIILLAAIVIGETIYLGILLKGKSQEPKQNPADLTFTKGIENVWIQVRIKKDTKDGQFTDSLYYSADEWAKSTAESVNKAIEGRVSNWIKATSTTGQ